MSHCRRIGVCCEKGKPTARWGRKATGFLEAAGLPRVGEHRSERRNLVSLLRREEGESSLDNLARGMGEGTITRGRAIKLAGAALLGSALSIFAGAEVAEARHRRCGHRAVLCIRRRPNGTRRFFCCPRALVQVSSCRTAILGELCVRIG